MEARHCGSGTGQDDQSIVIAPNMVSLGDRIRYRNLMMDRPTVPSVWLGIIPAAFILLNICHGQQEAASSLPTSVDWLTGARLQHELEQPFSGSWTSVEYRQLLRDVSADRRVSIVMDRRLDPSTELPVNVTISTLKTGLISIARQADADVSFPENFVYLGPRQVTRKLRTLIELRKLELQSKEVAVTKTRRAELLKPLTFASEDLETPREVLERFAQQARIMVSNAELVPHDLWAGMYLPEVCVVDAISVVLVQFDLTFRWRDHGATIELIPIPDAVYVERKHRPKKKLGDALTLIQQQLPRIEAQIVKSDIVVKGTVEDQEAVAGVLRGDPATGPVRIELPKPLKEQQFSLEASGVPVIALMRKLEESAVTFEYDADDLLAAGVDLEKKIQIKIKKATAEEFFKLIFDPLNVDFEIDKLTVKLKPRRQQ